ncbi:MAG: hypothetical protein JW963_02735 [Anaerolineales bacterium]|nr:hypothetical protein [Anaerolineales bacterium]
MMSNPTKTRISFFILIAALLIFINLMATSHYLMDDALITLRYSYNLGQIGSPVWNEADVHQPSMGYTTPLWMALNSIPAFFSGDRDLLITSARSISILALFAMAILIIREVDRVQISTPAKTAIIIGIFGQAGFAFHVNSAMETILFSCFVLLSVSSYIRYSTFTWAVVFGTLAFLTRPEGAIIVALLVAVHFFKGSPRGALAAGLGFGLVVLLLGLGILAYYGDILPNSLYVKQTSGISMASVRQTVFFIATLVFPYLAMSIYGAVVLKNRQSNLSLLSALALIGYFITVAPLMNVLGRYQWPSFVLLIYGSLPVFEHLIRNSRRYHWVVVALGASILITNVGNFLASNYFATTTGLSMKNLVELGKTMRPYRQADRWLVYHDAGAICYFSNWNCYDTIGLNNRAVAKDEIHLSDLLSFDTAAVVMQNIELSSSTAPEQMNRYKERYREVGYQYVDTYVTLREEKVREVGVMVFAKDEQSVRSMLTHANLQPNIDEQPFYDLYALARWIAKSR